MTNEIDVNEIDVYIINEIDINITSRIDVNTTEEIDVYMINKIDPRSKYKIPSIWLHFLDRVLCRRN